MLRYICRFALIAILVFSLGGCHSLEPFNDEFMGKIMTPSGRGQAFSGKWRDINNFESELQFLEDAVAFNDIIWDNIYYKIKKVDKESYLKTKYLPDGDPIYEDGEVKRIDVVTLYSSENYLGEFFIKDVDSLVFFIRDKVIKFEKVSNDVDPITEILSAGGQISSENQSDLVSGLLLGIRTPEGEGFSYGTLWFSNDKSGLRPQLYADNLFFPRTSGFWELKSEKNIQNSKDVLKARNIAIKEDRIDEESDESTLKKIDYVGNDYISLEIVGDRCRILQILPVDNLLSESGIKITDVLGDRGIELIDKSRSKLEGSIGSKKNIIVDEDMAYENFGIIREKGHWTIKARINYIANDQSEYMDLDLNTPVPDKITFYDTLVLSWYKIIDRVPDAIDAFTSPNKDMAIVRAKNRLLIYTINLGQLGKKPLAEILLKEGTEIVMAEWATGSYVEEWEQAFIGYGAWVF